MIRTNAIACGLCMVLLGIGTAAADTVKESPKSLRMRARPHWSPLRLAKQVAQVPAPDPAAADGDQPGDKPGVPASGQANPDQAVSASPEAAQAAPADTQSTELSETDFEKLAEQDTKEEIIVVTGSTI